MSPSDSPPPPIASEKLRAAPDAERLLEQMEERYQRLCEELTALESRLRELRTTAELCPQCGGSGERMTRGGLYGEMQKRPCPCRESG